jgi:ankyrin repeat protein
MSVRPLKTLLFFAISVCILSVVVANAAQSPNAAEKSGVFTALMEAARSGSDPKVITDLIKSGEDVNAKDKSGITALQYAVGKKGNLEIMNALIEGGADLSAKDEDGGTALMAAARRNENPEIITTLIKSGADVNAKDKNGKTAADLAEGNSYIKNSDAVRRLR